MPNIDDYLRWRGDLSFDERGFTLVDNFVLSALAYLDLTGVVPSLESGASVSVEQAAILLSQDPPTTFDHRRLVFVRPPLLYAMGRTRRYGQARLSRYVDETDSETGLQFSALTVHLEDGTAFVAYRGTDTSLVGWKEDFVMSFERVPAQDRAVDYLRHVLATGEGDARVGGHSKGAGLALWAVTSLDPAEQSRIITVYSNDGPGLAPELAGGRSFASPGPRLVRSGPPFSVIGMLFSDSEPDVVVASSGRGMMQHDIMTWQVDGAGPILEDGLSPRAVLVNRALDEWLEHANQDDRRAITDALFDALSAGGAALVQDVGRREFGGAESVLLSLARSRGRIRRPVRAGVRVIASAVRAVDFAALFRGYAAIRAVLLGLVGVFFVFVPHLAIQVLGAIALTTLCVVVAVRVTGYFLRFRTRHRLRTSSLIIIAVVILLMIAAGTQVSAFVVPEHVVFGGALLYAAWRSASAGFRLLGQGRRRRVRAALVLVAAVVCLLSGIVALSTVGLVLPFFILQVGQFCVLVSFVSLFLIVRDQAAAEYERLQLAREM